MRAIRIPLPELATYLEKRTALNIAHDVLFTTKAGLPLTKRRFAHIITDIGQRAGITNVRVSAHIFRHTFSRLWVLNGGDTFTLQRLLGHTTMEMVRRYVNLLERDLVLQHAKFNPGDRL